MRLRSCLTAFMLLSACLAPGRARAISPAVTRSASTNPADDQRQRLVSESADGENESVSLLLLGATFVALGIAIAAASRRESNAMEVTPAWTSVTAEEQQDPA